MIIGGMKLIAPEHDAIAGQNILETVTEIPIFERQALSCSNLPFQTCPGTAVQFVVGIQLVIGYLLGKTVPSA